jgi:hypothetical protein
MPGMLPSKTRPMTLPSFLMTGLPELPPMVVGFSPFRSASPGCKRE